MQPDIQRVGIELFLNTVSKRWVFANQFLYNLCAENPRHNDVDIIVGKLWIIGRCYAAAIERRRTNTDFKGDFYYDIVAPKMLSIGSELDERIAEINQFQLITEQNIDLVLNTHAFLMRAFFEITDLEKRSLASKYLHFHCPAMFFIYDSLASEEIGRRVKLDRQRAMKHYSSDCDRWYADFCIRSLELCEFINDNYGAVLSPRELDNLLLT